ncbi:hypothetical protein [Streptomyces misionensis]|uniref:hypothetical protein n=1 Tax=Streptomyces misionensis TaxID=67331 RepID=UPI00396C2542
MTVPKKQSTAAKKARAVQKAGGGKYTEVLAGQTCGQSVHPLDDAMGICARPPHSTWEPCSTDRDFDPAAFHQVEGERWAAEKARWEAMTPQERAEAELRFQESLYDWQQPLGDTDDYRLDH